MENTTQKHEILSRALGLKPKIEALNAAVAGQFVQREQIVLAFWLAIIADRASFLFGPPGVAKTAVTSFLSKLVKGMIFYEELMPVVVSPEQLIVGETALTERQNADGSKSVSVTNKLGLAACAHLVALDEIWKAQPAVLKVLFDLLLADGVRLGGQFFETPTLGVLAASNELPEPGNQLEALWARMAFRFDVRPLDRAGKLQMLKKRLVQSRNGNGGHAAQPMALEDLNALQGARPHVEVSDEIFGLVLDIYEALVHEDSEGFSWLWADDRRLDMVREGLQAHALIHGRAAVTKADLAVLEFMLWNDLEQISKVRAAIAPFIRTPESEARELVDSLMAAGGTVADFLSSGNHNKATGAIEQCNESIVALEELASTAGADEPAVRSMIDEVKTAKQAVIDIFSGKRHT